MVDEFVLDHGGQSRLCRRPHRGCDRRWYAFALLPPYARALAEYSRLREHSWSAPGHQGGVAFTKVPSGQAFFDFYGENLFRSDMGIERGALGSLLDHTGPVLASEQYAARVFGAHRSYSGVVGTSGSNRTIMQACANEDDLVIPGPQLPQVDRAGPHPDRRARPTTSFPPATGMASSDRSRRPKWSLPPCSPRLRAVR